jgi:hypothetical protein
VFYALVMEAGGLGSLIIGKLFDRAGLLVLLPVTIVVAVYAPPAFFGGFTLSLLGALLWGIGLGAHESVMQAAVAEMASQQRLGSAYGVFGAAFGVPGSPAALRLALSLPIVEVTPPLFLNCQQRTDELTYIAYFFQSVHALNECIRPLGP